MELEPGFKLSEAGPIPEDWRVDTILNVAPLQRGFDLPYRALRPGTVPVVASNGIISYHNKGQVKGPALATGRSGTIGEVHFIEVGLYWPHNTALWVTNFKGNDPKYLAYLYRTLPLRELANGSGVPTLDRNDVHALSVALPSTDEQRVISSTLSELNSWVEQAEAEAAKLASVKAAAMDALLTPTTRLPGFSGEWCRTRIGDLYDPLSTVAVARAAYVDGDGVACIHYGDIHVRYDGFVRVGHDKVAAVPAGIVRSATRLSSGDVLIADAAEDLEGVGKAVELVAPANFQVVGGLHVQALRPKAGKLALGFAGYLFRQTAYREAVERAASGLKVYGISKSQLSALEVVLPPTLDEQQAIAAVLSDIDAALSAARAVVAKARSVKAAAMDALLRGRVRLPGFGPTARLTSADALEAA